MITFLIVLACVASYVFMGGMLGARNHAIESAKCQYKDGHFEYRWCSHATKTLWIYGVFWLFTLPALAGISAGAKTTGPSRVEKRRANELAEAKHQAELARLRRIEDEELSRQLNAKPLR